MQRRITLDQCPGVRPIGVKRVGESLCIRRLIGKAIMKVAALDLKTEVGADNLCANLEAGIEGAIHAMCSEYEKAEEESGVLLVDAANAFNALNRKGALYHARHLWPAAAKYLFNTYKGWAPLYLADSKTQFFSKEGTTQGDPMSMAFYAIGVLPLIRAVKKEESIKDIIQMWYADDSSAGDRIPKLIKWLEFLINKGPQYGYFPEPSKSIFVVHPKDVEKTQQQLNDALKENERPKIRTDHRFLGGNLGNAHANYKYIQGKVDECVTLINQLAKIAHNHPQEAYTAITKSVQCQWQYVQRTVQGCGPWFAPIENAINDIFLPSLLKTTHISPQMRSLYALPVRFGVLGIPQPTNTADDSFKTSQNATQHLVDAIRQSSSFSLKMHQESMKNAKTEYKKEKDEKQEKELKALLPTIKEKQEKAIKRAVDHKTGAWLTAFPTARNGNTLSADEWRDGIAFRYGYEPKGLQPRCDGCGEAFDAEHGLKCRKGGLIIRRHNEVTRELQRISEMNYPGTVLEPVIRRGNSSLPEGDPEREGLIGDLLVRGGVHTPQTDVIIDVQVINLDTASRVKRLRKKREARRK